MMVPNRRMCSHAYPNTKRLKTQDETKEGQEQAMAVDRFLPHLPNDIIHKIFRLIPIKPAMRSTIVSKQWASLWPLGLPLLDFDDEEGNSSDHDADNLVRRKLLFMDFVESCLKHCEKNKLLELDSFRLRMRYDGGATRSRIDEWFSFVVDRCVKGLDISIRRKDDNNPDKSTYYMPQAILNAQFLTSLILEHVIITESCIDLINLPLLRTMSLSAVLFDCRMHSERSPWMRCPSIEHLSLASCSFSSSQREKVMRVLNSNLKLLQVTDCQFLGFVVGAENLESFTFSSGFSKLHYINLLRECIRLKYINIYAEHLVTLQMHRKCQASLKATIETPKLKVFYYDGFLLPGDIISMKAQNPKSAIINLDWDNEGEVLEPSFSTWRDFLHNLDCCNILRLGFHHDAVAECFMFPKKFRRTSSPPLPNIKNVFVAVERPRCPQTVARKNVFKNSLRWMAPSATMPRIKFWDRPVEGSSEEDE